jgi:starch synthase (maltosyl-transferring)
MPLSVLSVAYPFAPVGSDAVGGAEQVLSALDRALVAHGHRSIVIACEGSRTAGELISIPAVAGPIGDQLKQHIWGMLRRVIGETVSQRGIDLAHLHGIDFHEYLPEHVPVLATLHLPLDWYPGWIFDGIPNLWLNCVSEAQQRTAPAGARLLPPIANGVPRQLFETSQRKRGHAMILSRICPEKGIDLALQACHLAHVPLLIGGQVFPYEAHERYFQEQVVPLLDARRRFLGPLGFGRKRRLLAAARCVLVPSLVAETSSLTAIEALACGTPVIAFPNGALPDVVEHGRTGFIVASVEQMAEAIAEAPSIDPEVCRAAAVRRFPPAEMERRYLALYRRIAAASHRLDERSSSSCARAATARESEGLPSLREPPAHAPRWGDEGIFPPRELRMDRPDQTLLQKLAASRIAIEAVEPAIDGGRFAAKTIVGKRFRVEADIFCDGHDVIAAALLCRHRREKPWSETPMRLLTNDRWRATISFDEPGHHEFRICAWRDLFASWRAEVIKKHEAGQDISLELIEGRHLVEKALQAGSGGAPHDRSALKALLAEVESSPSEGDVLAVMISEDMAVLMRRLGVRTNLTQSETDFPVFVDRERAAFSAWYELMPRSQSGRTDRHGTFDDVIARLPYVRDMGFDVLYFPPIHPIGRTNRKGRNNSLTPAPDDPGSPYAIGSQEGGHDAIHSELGSVEDFERLVKAAADHGLEIALDFAIQCSPDHPWIREHPEWFDWRPDGTIKFAENPPKKYEDIVNVHFYREAIPGLWYALRDVVLFWLGHGVRIFRVDNPHTKPLPFWEWMIEEVRKADPGVIFLSEAFTRPKMMKRLAKVGFNQSYSYFTWRNTKQELTDYLTELTQEECRHYMRPNFFVNTPDINPRYLQTSGRPGFQARLMLAATLGTNYGVYSGFELCEAQAIPGKEEYLNSEKYEIRAWDWDRPGNIRPDIIFINRLRQENPALQQFTNLTFYNAWNDNILYYGKYTDDLTNFLLFAVNLDPHNPQGAHFEVPLWEFGLPDDAMIEAEDLVTGQPFSWAGKIQHMFLDPHQRPYMAWRLIAPGARR